MFFLITSILKVSAEYISIKYNVLAIQRYTLEAILYIVAPTSFCRDIAMIRQKLI